MKHLLRSLILGPIRTPKNVDIEAIIADVLGQGTATTDFWYDQNYLRQQERATDLVYKR